MHRRLDAPARINAGSVAVDEQAQHYRRVIAGRASAAVLPGERRHIELIDNVDHEAREVVLGQPIFHRGRQQIRRGAVYRPEIGHGYTPGIVQQDDAMTIALINSSERLSPTGS